MFLFVNSLPFTFIPHDHQRYFDTSPYIPHHRSTILTTHGYMTSPTFRNDRPHTFSHLLPSLFTTFHFKPILVIKTTVSLLLRGVCFVLALPGCWCISEVKLLGLNFIFCFGLRTIWLSLLYLLSSCLALFPFEENILIEILSFV